MEYLRRYLEQESIRRQVRAWLGANDGAALAARSMFYLNRFARTTSLDETKRVIYGLKTKLIRQLHEHGYCVRVDMSIRNKECWGCGGTGDDWQGETCERCGGTGVYSSTRLYDFTFRVGRRLYRWHQPGSMVDWPVVSGDSNAPAVYEPALPPRGMMNRELCLLYVFTVAEYLRGQGVEPGLELRGLRDALLNEWWVGPGYGLWQRLGEIKFIKMKGSTHGRDIDF